MELEDGGGGREEQTAGTAGTTSSSRLYSLEQELQNKTMQIGEMEIRLAEQGNLPYAAGKHTVNVVTTPQSWV